MTFYINNEGEILHASTACNYACFEVQFDSNSFTILRNKPKIYCESIYNGPAKCKSDVMKKVFDRGKPQEFATLENIVDWVLGRMLLGRTSFDFAPKVGSKLKKSKSITLKMVTEFRNSCGEVKTKLTDDMCSRILHSYNEVAEAGIAALDIKFIEGVMSENIIVCNASNKMFIVPNAYAFQAKVPSGIIFGMCTLPEGFDTSSGEITLTLKLHNASKEEKNETLNAFL